MNAGLLKGDRAIDKICQSGKFFSKDYLRGIRIYFLDSELRNQKKEWPPNVQVVTSSKRRKVRVIDIGFSSPLSRFSQRDYPLMASMKAELIDNQRLPNGNTVWILSYEFSSDYNLEAEAARWRNQLNAAETNQPDRIAVTGINTQEDCFIILDAAAK